jgi:molybdopterin-guanine dinucleotide biosynthesis protein A
VFIRGWEMIDRQWTGVVLAGGQSSRMGRDKALIEFKGRTLLERQLELLRPHAKEILVIGDPTKHTPTHATVIPDDIPGQGPLGGILTALRCARYVRVLVLACDLPNISDRLLLRLKAGLDNGVDAVVPKHSLGSEPLVAAYHRHAMEAFQKALGEGERKMSLALDRIHTVPLVMEPGEEGWPVDLFRNLNAPTDL